MSAYRLVVVIAILVVIALEIVVNTDAGTRAKPPEIYSVRTEPGARGHVLTTVAFAVRIQGYDYACVVTEDDGRGPTPTLAQSCDFGVSR